MENPVSRPGLSRRTLFGASALGATSAAAAALADPGQAAAQAVGVKKADLPDLTIKEVKVYVAELGNVRRLNNTETGEIVSIVTNSGIEGNMSIGNRASPPGEPRFLDYAKSRLLGKSALDVTSITPVPNTARFSAYGALTAGRGGSPSGGVFRAGGGRGVVSTVPAGAVPAAAAPLPAGGRGSMGGGFSQAGVGVNYLHDSIIDVCLWDILGKAVDRPIYKLLGGTKTRAMAYASSQHLP